MAKSIKLGADTYLDSSGVTVNSVGRTLKDVLTITSGSGDYTSTTTASKVGTITMPSGVKLLRVRIIYAGSRPDFLALCASGSVYIQYGPVTNSSQLTQQYLTITCLCTETVLDIYAAHNSVTSNNHYYYNYYVIS